MNPERQFYNQNILVYYCLADIFNSCADQTFTYLLYQFLVSVNTSLQISKYNSVSLSFWWFVIIEECEVGFYREPKLVPPKFNRNWHLQLQICPFDLCRLLLGPVKTRDLNPTTTWCHICHSLHTSGCQSYLNVSFILLYTSLVRPHLDYASAVWCPYKIGDIEVIEKVQKRACYTIKETSICRMS